MNFDELKLTDPKVVAQAVETLDSSVVLTFPDKTVRTTNKWLIFNAPFWKVLHKWEVPITASISVFEGLATNAAIADYQTRVLNAVIQKNGGRRPRGLRRDCIGIINDLLNLVASDLGNYICGGSGYEMCKLVNTKEFKEITSVKVDVHASTQVNEKLIKDVHNRAMTLLEDPKLPYNILYPFHRLKTINRNQLPQVLVSGGFRADIDDSIIRYPITDSFLEGLKSTEAVFIDSLAAKVSIWYNNSALPDSQYFNRRQQLVASSLERLHEGDCGSTLTVAYHIVPGRGKWTIGSNIVVDGVMTQITEDNYKAYEGKTLNFRSPMLCRHTDGVCEACAGLIALSMSDNTNIGQTSILKMTERITQLLLSNKHFSRTDSTMYVLPKDFRRFMEVVTNDIYIKEPFWDELKKLEFGISFSNMQYIDDLRHVSNISAINEEHFSAVTALCLRRSTGEVVTPPINLRIDKQSPPFFTRDILWYIKQNMSRMSIGETIWIPLDQFDMTKPILRCLVSNYSIKEYSSRIVQFFRKTITEYTSVTEVLKDFSDLFYTKLEVNLYHMQMMLRAYMVTSHDNYHIPVVTDTEDVMFGSDRNIISNRSVGAELAFERFGEHMSNPKTYLLPKEKNIYDTYFGFDDSNPLKIKL